MYRAFDIFFFLFHTAFIVFVLTGWIWRRTHRVHLAAVVLTAFSWFGLGLRYGWGYCPCTEWHWRVRMRLGDQDLPRSYITLLIHRLTGIEASDNTVDIVTITAFAIVAALSVCTNLRRLKSRDTERRA